MQATIWYSTVLFFTGTAAAALCLVAEFRKSKKNDLRFDGKLCSLPQSSALGFGIAALLSLFIGQIVGSFFVYRELRSANGRRNHIKHAIPYILLSVSWVSFLITAVLLSGASSMSRSQPFGEGWVDGECYLVKSGVYGGSAFLGMISLGSALGSALLAMTMKEVTPVAESTGHGLKPPLAVNTS